MTSASTSGSPLASEHLADLDAIRWPAAYVPKEASVHARNELTIEAPPTTVWAWLLRAELWPTWYANAAEMHFLSHAGPNLRDRSRFRWRTFGMRITSKVLEFEPPTDHTAGRIAWDAHGIGIRAWHAWLLTPTPDGGTHVLTEEVQHGWRALLGKTLAPRRMEAQHQLWLEGLSRQARSGPVGLPGSMADSITRSC